LFSLNTRLCILQELLSQQSKAHREKVQEQQDAAQKQNVLLMHATRKVTVLLGRKEQLTQHAVQRFLKKNNSHRQRWCFQQWGLRLAWRQRVVSAFSRVGAIVWKHDRGQLAALLRGASGVRTSVSMVHVGCASVHHLVVLWCITSSTDSTGWRYRARITLDIEVANNYCMYSFDVGTFTTTTIMLTDVRMFPRSDRVRCTAACNAPSIARKQQRWFTACPSGRSGRRKPTTSTTTLELNNTCAGCSSAGVGKGYEASLAVFPVLEALFFWFVSSDQCGTISNPSFLIQHF
jgi:hypothetical protein